MRSAAEVLATSPGATVHQSGAPGQSASLSLRGASADESLILLDGIPLQGPGGGSIDLATVPAALLDRMAHQAEARQQPRSAHRFRNQAKDASEQADVVLIALGEAARSTLQSVADSDDVAQREAVS